MPEAQVPDFCESKGVPTHVDGCHLMAKVEVNGAAAHPVWTLAKSKFPGDIKWNFDGIFLFDKNGGVASRHSIRAPPTKEQIEALM